MVDSGAVDTDRASGPTRRPRRSTSPSWLAGPCSISRPTWSKQARPSPQSKRLSAQGRRPRQDPRVDRVVKALTLWQPWASLIAVGAKTIETRSWSTSYRGPLAIHAAKRKPDTELLEDGWAGELYGGDGIDSCLAPAYETAEEDYIPDRLPAPDGRWSLALAPEFL